VSDCAGVRDVPDLIEAAIFALLAGDGSAAHAALASIDADRLFVGRKEAFEQIRRLPRQARVSGRADRPYRRRSVPESARLEVFKRDHFTCRYAHCRRRTIHLPVLQLLSRHFPDALPYKNPNWRPVHAHIVYWTYSTSLEHKVALPEKGLDGWNDKDNLLAACYQCNDIKKDLRLSDLGWAVSDNEPSSWNDLSEYLPQLRQLAGVAAHDPGHTAISARSVLGRAPNLLDDPGSSLQVHGSKFDDGPSRAPCP
jgi:hypothetical protein